MKIFSFKGVLYGLSRAHISHTLTSLSFMKNYLSLVKFSHTIFALPFALTGFFVAISVQGRG